MSLARMALRLAAAEALAPYAALATQAWPTIAGKNVYDSRLDPIVNADEAAAFFDQLDNAPVVVLYTEDHATDPPDGPPTPPQWELVDLVAELIIASVDETEVTGPDGQVELRTAINVASLDAVNEALIDTLDGQIRRQFDPRNVTQSNDLMRRVVIELREIKSFPDRSPDRATKVARRTTRFHFRIRQDEWPPFAAPVTPIGLAALPRPLRSVAEGLDRASSGHQLAQKVAEMISQGPVAEPLQSVGIAGQLFPSAADAAAAPPPIPGELADDALQTNIVANAVIPAPDPSKPYDPNPPYLRE
jgi:hypothetical protein